MTKRFITTKHAGIRKDTKNGNYRVEWMDQGVRYCKTFSKKKYRTPLSEAIRFNKNRDTGKVTRNTNRLKNGESRNNETFESFPSFNAVSHSALPYKLHGNSFSIAPIILNLAVFSCL
jgi:hypothetical protein